MVKGEHLRPLLGFAVVCAVAALILGAGLGRPAATIRRIVGAQQVLPSSSLTELVLGRLFEPAPERSVHLTPTRPTSSTSPGLDAEQRASLVLGSPHRPSRGASSGPGQSAPQSTQHVPQPSGAVPVAHATDGGEPQAAAPVPTPVTHPVTQPVSQPVTPPVAQPVSGTGGSPRHHGWGHSQQGRHPSEGATPSVAVPTSRGAGPSAHVASSSPGAHSYGAHSYGAHVHATGGQPQPGQPQPGQPQPGQPQHGHGHGDPGGGRSHGPQH